MILLRKAFGYYKESDTENRDGKYSLKDGTGELLARECPKHQAHDAPGSKESRNPNVK